MTTSGTLLAARARELRANWPALLLPLIAADTLGLFHGPVLGLLVAATVVTAAAAPRLAASLAPFAAAAYGGYGLILFHALSAWAVETQPALYGVVRAGTNDNAGFVLAQAVIWLAAGTWLLARPGAPGGGAVRHAAAQLRGADGQPKTVPPLLLLPVIFLWEELFGDQLWFGVAGGRALAVALALAGIGLLTWWPRAAAAAGVAGLLLFGLYGALEGAWHLWFGPSQEWLASGFGGTNYGRWLWGWTYGAVALNSGPAAAAAVLQGTVALGAACALVPRLLTWSGDLELAQRAQALTRRVNRLTQTRSEAAETAVAELRRIERDLHDGAQARLVAVGMSLRAAEQLMTANPEAARALVAEARQTSSRALDDLRDLVRGIYPPVLADRGLADAVRALALDAPLPVRTEITLPGQPPVPVAAAAYFAIAEALTNAARHADPSLVEVTLRYADGALRATVTDDGRGGADPARGTGLTGVERRLATFDGVLAVNSPPGGPTIVAIEIPYAPPGLLAEAVRSSWQTRTLA